MLEEKCRRRSVCSKNLEFLGHYGAATELARHYSGCHRITSSTDSEPSLAFAFALPRNPMQQLHLLANIRNHSTDPLIRKRPSKSWIRWETCWAALVETITEPRLAGLSKTHIHIHMYTHIRTHDYTACSRIIFIKLATQPHTWIKWFLNKIFQELLNRIYFPAIRTGRWINRIGGIITFS